MPSRIFNWFDNVGSPSGNYVTGPYELGSVNKLIRVRVRMAIVFDPETIGTSTEIVIPIVMGVQYGDAGYTPLNLPADADNGQFLAVEGFSSSVGTATWAPATDAAGYLAITGARLDYAGQNYVGNSIELYVNVQSTFTSSAAWTTSGTLEAIFV